MPSSEPRAATLSGLQGCGKVTNFLELRKAEVRGTWLCPVPIPLPSTVSMTSAGSVCALQTNVCSAVNVQDDPGWRPHHAGAIGTGRCSILRKNFRELRKGEVRRIPLPRTSVNK